MNASDEHEDHHEPDAALLRQLQALPRDMTPSARTWERIEAALQTPSLETARVARIGHPSRRRWVLAGGGALAAAVALLAVLPLDRGSPVLAPTTGDVALLAQADVISEHYRQALTALPPITTAELAPALDELDASAHSIRAALAERPHARFLLDQLQRTYAKRLELTRMAARDASTHST